MRMNINNYNFAQRKLKSKLQGYYKFNENLSVAKNYASSGGTIGAKAGNPIYQVGKLGMGCNFNDQQTGYRSPNGHLHYNFDSGDGTTILPFSISFWMNLASERPVNDTQGMVFGLIGRTGGAKDQWYVQYPTTVSNVVYEKLRFVKVDGGLGKTRIITATVTLPLDEWLFVSITDSGTGHEKIYINGQEVPTDISDNGYVTFLSGTPYGAAISMLSAANYAGFFFPGALDDIAIFKDYILSPDDIGWLYNNGNGNELL